MVLRCCALHSFGDTSNPCMIFLEPKMTKHAVALYLSVYTNHRSCTRYDKHEADCHREDGRVHGPGGQNKELGEEDGRSARYKRQQLLRSIRYASIGGASGSKGTSSCGRAACGDSCPELEVRNSKNARKKINQFNLSPVLRAHPLLCPSRRFFASEKRQRDAPCRSFSPEPLT